MYISSPIPRKKARIEIIPLIDIMFFLLASFMMVSLSQVHMKGIKVNLPRGSSGETQAKREYISVSVDKNGTYFFDKDEVTDTDLLQRLVKVHQSSPEAKVFVRGDRDTAHLNVSHLLDMLRSAGFYKISFEITSEALKAVPGGPKVIFRYGYNASKTVTFPAGPALAFVDGSGRCSGNSPHRGCICSKARGTAGRYSS
jgi:biopolymer transport protein ExbD